MLQVNFILVAIVNLGLRILPFSILRVFWLRLWNKKVSYGCSLQSGVRITSIIGHLEIGDHSIVGVKVLLDNRRGVYISDNVNISRECQILTLGHDCADKNFVTKGSSVVIEKSAWIFMGVKVMPGVTIGYNAVVFPFSVVTKSLEPLSAYAGIPAKKVKVDVVERNTQKPYRFFCAF